MVNQGQKSEQPTEKRLKKAREEGQFPVSREFVASAQFVGAIFILRAYGASWLAGFQIQFQHGLSRAFQAELSPADCIALARDLVIRCFLPIGYAGLMLVVLTFALQIVSTGFGFNSNRLVPSFKGFNVTARLQELPKQNAVSLLQAAFLLPVSAIILFHIVRDNLASFLLMPLGSVHAGAGRLWDSMQTLLWKVSGVLLLFGIVDLLRVRRKHSSDLRMTKQEVQDEHKENEGNPQIKAQIRRLRRDVLRKQMMKDVASATVVVVNPTHYAIAVRYDMESMSSPQVVAKGKNYLAARIRQRAIENGVPIVENPPLARALYKSVEVGQEIPVHFYRAVAEVLAYIFKMRNLSRAARER